eukprot:Phypoly_transcript_10046.p1 GENE.Phypoly_transcript_10046~~Phypoly_transcript_10046.p1  ORF type:complete len:418 (+),score=39.71 Phypoly_transcript_10046:121-1254(+)
MDKIRAMDPDDVLAYNTIKLVKIRDRRLGCIHHLLQFAIFIYIVVYTIILQKRYLRVEAPSGAFRATVQQPPVWPDASTLPYCTQRQPQYPPGYDNYPCTYFLGLDLTYPPAMMDSILVSTRIKDSIYNVTNKNCSALPTTLECAPNPDVAQSTSTRYYMAGIENFTLYIEHAIFGRQNKITVTNKDSDGKLHYANPHFKDPYDHDVQKNLTIDTRQGDIFNMSTILIAANVKSLDDDSQLVDNRTYRYDGVLLIMVVEYSNKGYSNNKLQYDYYVYQIPGVSVVAQAPSVSLPTGYSQRTWYGIRVIFALAGTVGKFDFQTLLTALVSGAVLVTAATTVVDLLLLYIMPDRALYAKHKYEITEDFSDVRDRAKSFE